ncbi:MAG: proton-conducting transporter membrane subunit, partial [Flavobacteriales bacterium]
IHFAGNAFLRTYQLLVSPSVVSYLIREQFFNYSPNDYSIEDRLPMRWGNTLYILSLKEYNLDNFLYRYFWIPLKKIGKSLEMIKSTWGIMVITSFVLSAIFLRLKANIFADNHKGIIAILFAFAGLTLVLKAFTERFRVHFAWWLVVTNHLWVSTAVSFNEHYDFSHDLIYLSGILLCGIIGHVVIAYFKKKNERLDLNRFYGLSSQYPRASFLLLLCSLAVAGFPITPSFIGEDMIMSHIHEHQFMLALAVSFSFIVDGLALMRIYARLCLGSDAQSIFNSSYRSS